MNKATGKESTAGSAFSESNCGSMTCSYYLSIKKRGARYTKDTVDLARQLSKEMKQSSSSKSTDIELDEQAMLCKYPSHHVFVFVTTNTFTTRISAVFDP